VTAVAGKKAETVGIVFRGPSYDATDGETREVPADVAADLIREGHARRAAEES